MHWHTALEQCNSRFKLNGTCLSHSLIFFRALQNTHGGGGELEVKKKERNINRKNPLF